MLGDQAPRGSAGLLWGALEDLFSRLRSFLTTFTWRERFEDGLDDEVRFHLAAYAEDLIRTGVPRAEAVRRARVHFGSVEGAKDACRQARGLRLADELGRDLRFATRSLVKDRWYTLGAAFVLALAIGVTTAIFTLVNAVLFRGLPVDDERIVFLGTRDANGREAGVSLLDLEDWENGARTLSEIAAHVSSGVNVSDDVEAPALLPAPFISESAFRLVGAQPALGRVFSRAEEQPGAAGTVVLGHALWQSRYGGDPEILGRTIRVNSRPAVVIGVMPEGFKFPGISDLWLPLGFMDGPGRPRDARTHQAVGRLADGATMDEARAELEAIAGRLADEYPETNAGVQPIVQRYSERSVAPQRGFLLTLMAAVCFVLLIACANVGGLMLARSAQRSQEVALLTALGASRGRILRPLLVESTLLAAVGCLLGAAVAFVAVPFFGAQLMQCQGCMPYWIEWTPDGRVLAFMCFTGLATGVLCGVAPALHVSGHDPNDVLKQMGRTGGGTRTARHWTNGLLVAEIALTLVLLVGTGLMVRSFVALYDATRVVDGSGLLTFAMRFSGDDSTDDRKAFLRAVEDRLAAMPELSAATLSSVRPFEGGSRRWLELDGRPLDDPLPAVTYVTIGDDYFDTLGLRLLSGRRFGPLDGEPGREFAIVNQRFVDVHFPDENPLGRRLRLSNRNVPADPLPWITIVGVSPDVPQRSNPNTEDVVYFPLRGDPGYGACVIVRPRIAAGPVMSRIREELAHVDRDLPLFEPKSLEEAMASYPRRQRALMTMLGFFAGLALLLTSVGAYSVTAYAAAQRRQEIGIRVALGAPRTRVMPQCMRRSMAPVAVGVAFGAGGAVAAGRVLSSLLVETSATDQFTFLVCTALVVVAALAACFVSARHAAWIDPVSVLRST